MSTKEGFFVFDSENSLAGDKPIVGKTGKDLGNVERKGLTDISNLPQSKHTILDEKSHFISASTKEYINKLQKENMALMKLLADRNKIIEMSGIELHKLRVNMQKLQQQNLQLAQSNSQNLAELNVDKDRLKQLQHELGCKNGLLVAKRLELKVDVLECEETLEPSEAVRDDKKPYNIKRRPQSKSLGPATVKQVQDKKAENKRLCVRKSAIFKSEEPKPTEDLFEVDGSMSAICSLCDEQMQEDLSTSKCLSVEKDDKDAKPTSSYQGQECGRTSIGRPSRQAAKKVNSYKEIPLNVKMRRPE